jgi:hypothetical protein
MIYDSEHLPAEFRQEVYDFIKTEYAKERKEGQTEEQFIYSTRKKGFGTLKKKWWDLPYEVKNPVMRELESRFALLFTKLKVTHTTEIVKKSVRPVIVKKGIPDLTGTLL